MTEYLSKPDKARVEQETEEAKRKVEKVVNGNVRLKKKSGVNKLANIFIAEDVSNVKDYIINEVVIPTIRDTVWSVFTNALDMFLYGGGKNKKSSNIGKVSYRQFYDSKPSNTSRSNNAVVGGFSFDDVELDNRRDAEAVVDQLRDAIDVYGFARVADLYDLVGVTGPHTAMNYGWTNLRNAEVVRVRGGKYTIRLPRAIPIN